MRWLALPGGIGAFAGATLLSNLDGEAARPWIALFLVSLGVYVLIRFAFLGGKHQGPTRGLCGGPLLAPLGLVAGFFDAVGGGGWGPISTPTLLASGRMEPRKVVGTVDTSEFVVAVCASIGFLISLNRSIIALPVVAALLVGGVIAAPIAAWLVRWLHPRILGATIGGVIVLTNGRTLMTIFGIEGTRSSPSTSPSSPSGLRPSRSSFAACGRSAVSASRPPTIDLGSSTLGAALPSHRPRPTIVP